MSSAQKFTKEMKTLLILLVAVAIAAVTLVALHVSLLLAGMVGILIVVIAFMGEMIALRYPKYAMYFYALSFFVIILLIGLAMNGYLGTLGVSSINPELATYDAIALAIGIIVIIGAVFLYMAEKKYRVLSKAAGKLGL